MEFKNSVKIAAYHVDNNKDVFFKEIMEGIEVIFIGMVCNFEKPLVVVGGNRKCIQFKISIINIMIVIMMMICRICSRL